MLIFQSGLNQINFNIDTGEIVQKNKVGDLGCSLFSSVLFSSICSRNSDQINLVVVVVGWLTEYGFQGWIFLCVCVCVLE